MLTDIETCKFVAFARVLYQHVIDILVKCYTVKGEHCEFTVTSTGNKVSCRQGRIEDFGKGGSR